MKVEALRHWRRLEQRRRFTIAGACGGFLLLLGIAGSILWSQLDGSSAASEQDKATVKRSVAPTIRLTLPPPDLLKPITPEEALAENAQRPFSDRPDSPAPGFKLQAEKTAADRALECLTQAVYYEAASEGADGQRAVAQIVLNRMRHPAYPASVCGVVYQGSERPTGCQFTFTCDGSLARIPVQSLWKQARRIAGEALAGKVFGKVGHATHYHADYVLPYWADSLDKSAKIGRHIFYRLKGALGASSTFRQRYAGVEPVPPPPSTVDLTLENVQDPGTLMAPPPTEGSPLQVDAGELIASTKPQPQLVADASVGTLLIDGEAPAPKATRRQNDAPCTKPTSGKQLRPLTANDARATSPSEDCQP